MSRTSARIDTSARSRLAAQLDGIVQRLHRDGEVPQTTLAVGDFLDVAQGLEQQELARLGTARLAERARRLQSALARLYDGEYGVCVECSTPIEPKRLRALPDTTTCVACQERLEREPTWTP